MSRNLRLYTALEIALGLAALAAVSLLLDIDGRVAVDVPGLPSQAGLVIGVLYWVALSLGGSALVTRQPAAVVTFDVPFLAAATVLGGPVAGGWVGMIGCFERREIRGLAAAALGRGETTEQQVPWYGVLVNHSLRALGAIVGGIAVLALSPLVDPVFGSNGAARDLLMTLLVAVAEIVLGDALSFATYAMRSNRSYGDAVEDFGFDYWLMEGAEAIVAWLMVVVFLAGWWAPVVCAAALGAIWKGRPETGARMDPLSGVWNEGEFLRRVGRILGRPRQKGRRIVLMLIEVQNLDDINRRWGRDAGDQVLREVGRRLRTSLRPLDDAGRLEGGLFGVLLLLPKRDARFARDADTAEVIAWRLHKRLTHTVELGPASVEVECSIGMASEARTDGGVSAEWLLRAAKRTLVQVQESGDGVA